MAYYHAYQRRYPSYDEMVEHVFDSTGRNDRTRKVAPETHLYRPSTESDAPVYLQHYGANLAVFYPDRIEVCPAGYYRSPASKARLNMFLPREIVQHQHRWYVWEPERVLHLSKVGYVTPGLIRYMRELTDAQGVRLSWSGEILAPEPIDVEAQQRAERTRTQRLRAVVDPWLNWWEEHYRGGACLDHFWVGDDPNAGRGGFDEAVREAQRQIEGQIDQKLGPIPDDVSMAYMIAAECLYHPNLGSRPRHVMRADHDGYYAGNDARTTLDELHPARRKIRDWFAKNIRNADLDLHEQRLRA